MTVQGQLADALADALSARPEVLEAYLFGSTANGRDTALSDVDVAVYVDTAARVEPLFGYAAELSADLSSVLGRNDIDVVVLNDAPPLLYHRVLARGIRLCSRHLPSTTSREGQALSRYCDFVPQLKRSDAAIAGRLATGRFGR